MIEVEDVSKTLGSQRVLSEISFRVNTGDIVALLGASGAGKSVLLKNLVGLMEPDKGRVHIDGRDVHRSTGSELAELRNSIGMLFQGGALFDSMTVYENLAFPLREKTRLSPAEVEARVMEQLQRVDMADARRKYPAELSGGMQKRAALARTLVRNPEVIFFDEPTTGLDPLIGNSILRLIRDLHEDYSFTAVIVTHDFQKVFPIAHKVAMIHKGQVLTYTTPEKFMESDNEVISNFVCEALEGPLEAKNYEE